MQDAEARESTEPTEFGRVDEHGNVYVLTEAGERVVGQWPQGDPAAALAFYRKRYDGLAIEVDLLEQRIKGGALSPEDATSSAAVVRQHVREAQAVGDLAALLARLDALQPLIDKARGERKAERAAKAVESKQAKEKIVAAAEQLALGSDWRNGANRLRELLATWKALPRVDKPSDDALWHRFSSARTTYTRRRKQHFGEVTEQREIAQHAKEKLVKDAEALSESTEWGDTARAYRDLMSRWKAAGPAPKDIDEALWKRFRAAQDTFFTARDAVNASIDQEYAANAEVKKALLVEAEALLPVTDAKAARGAFRGIADRWDEAGKVPRADMKDLENRFKKVEQSVRGAEDERWRNSNPEAKARADETVSKLEASIASLVAVLAKAEAAGNTKGVSQAQADIESRQLWLDQAKKAQQEFTI
ncbi:MAG: DUF349 domain-containing protein [Nocardioidaceae bacterium]|nr:DUF349 domain-containing protein [Nocardioidaceae bacterium]